MINIDGREFSFTIATDNIRNGLGVELNEIISDEEIFIAEVFRNDSIRKIEFNTFESNVPYSAIVKLFEIFELKVTREFEI
ncbi:hypothetical protein [Marinicellulosiphila megalodicopiae]|uniref:hypothetical protein n=1 Tax=Marinicellulosiphila megalodicopiae TaxID=2724896 RepID=UPI003BB1D850